MKLAEPHRVGAVLICPVLALLPAALVPPAPGVPGVLFVRPYGQLFAFEPD